MNRGKRGKGDTGRWNTKLVLLSTLRKVTQTLLVDARREKRGRCSKALLVVSVFRFRSLWVSLFFSQVLFSFLSELYFSFPKAQCGSVAFQRCLPVPSLFFLFFDESRSVENFVRGNSRLVAAIAPPLARSFTRSFVRRPEILLGFILCLAPSSSVFLEFGRHC